MGHKHNDNCLEKKSNEHVETKIKYNYISQTKNVLLFYYFYKD